MVRWEAQLNEPDQASQPNQSNRTDQVNQPGGLRDVRWLRLHALFAPFGVCAVTALLLAGSGQWAGRESLPAAASLVDLGAAVYGMIAVLAERSINMVFWALEQRRKRAQEREAATQQRVAAAQDTTRAETLVETVSDLVSAGIIKPDQQDLVEWAQAKGIDLDKLPIRQTFRARSRRRERRPRHSAE